MKVFYLYEMKYQYTFLVQIQFLGYRFHGWQKQKTLKTVHEMIDRTLNFIFGDSIKFKTLGVGRTDSKVSASQYGFQLFLNSKTLEENFLEVLNYNLPPDINAISIKNVSSDFNIIHSSKFKEYHYYFSFGQKNHPFAAPFMVGLNEHLDIDLMKIGANLFEGEHYFHKYCTKPSENTVFKRVIDSCEIVENTILQANFFPNKSYVLKVRGKGFLRYQIRLMMGTLFELGRGHIDLGYIEKSLQEDNDRGYMREIAPASGLQLYDVVFEDV